MPSKKLPALFISQDEVRGDVAFSEKGPGKRKIVVTTRYNDEVPAPAPFWRGTQENAPAAVLETPDLEVSYFTDAAPQDRHFHHRTTEIYTVQSGTMAIEVSGETYTLSTGDSIVVLPGTVHRVLRVPRPFRCQIIAANIATKDKTVVPPA